MDQDSGGEHRAGVEGQGVGCIGDSWQERKNPRAGPKIKGQGYPDGHGKDASGEQPRVRLGAIP